MQRRGGGNDRQSYARDYGSGGRGSGEYYKRKYAHPSRSHGGASERDRGGGWERDRGGTGRNINEERTEPRERPTRDDRQVSNGTHDDLRRLLLSLDRQGFSCYKQIKGSYEFPFFTLHIDYIQADPYAPPSKVRVVVTQEHARFPAASYSSPVRAVALADLLCRRVYNYIHDNEYDHHASDQPFQGSKGGQIVANKPSQHVLQRTAVSVSKDDGTIEARFQIGLPGQGRSILGGWAADLVTQTLPKVISACLLHKAHDPAQVMAHVLSVEDQETLRNMLSQVNPPLFGFVANGAVLPRMHGASDLPMSRNEAQPFVSPPSLEREFTLPNSGTIKGMGIPPGVTLIVGGGFHGKSTLLNALSVGIYNHVPGDGREFVVLDSNAVRIRAEDGRNVTGVDISPFINNLPNSRSTQCFNTSNASGSTSQAANIVEAIELGCTGLLIDEDQSATNFMIRDRRMQLLVSKKNEPITPFIYKVRALFHDMGVSTILVIGGAGDYFDVADTVVMLKSYKLKEVTEKAKEIAAKTASELDDEGGAHFGLVTPRAILPTSFPPADENVKVGASASSVVRFGSFEIPLNAIEQIVENSQVNAIADTMGYLQRKPGILKDTTMLQLMTYIQQQFDGQDGLDWITLGRRPSGNYSRPRSFELAAALNRFRSLKVQQYPQQQSHQPQQQPQQQQHRRSDTGESIPSNGIIPSNGA
eukprot:TRINITY_DN1295_c1_g1_i5.p1 TRINITY_DN1295_c1_g1~~TRINITY_DN1295_c1_g1_i5.p1  ORF type:complete len:749 (-),score=101.26 TRINITY_DN1295_c1_g1_i5:70-2175(-)